MLRKDAKAGACVYYLDDQGRIKKGKLWYVDRFAYAHFRGHDGLPVAARQLESCFYSAKKAALALRALLILRMEEHAVRVEEIDKAISLGKVALLVEG
ncbi:MAG: hypothetical protein E6G97_18660 [Alphaproteobacteria bacterium]|nr:MAG: hypothetical protein E6G97_18660 [Alphaproteobacteria bacterium]